MRSVFFGLGVLGLILLGAVCLLWGAPKAQTISLSTRDGWTLSAVYLPASSRPKTVILLHDLNKDKNAFAAFRDDLAKAGFGYLALDLRGHGQSTNRGLARSFAREGVDNEFNKMTQDVQAAVSFLEAKGVSASNIIILGAGLGANVAAKSAVLTGVGAVGLISPAANVRDVLVIPSMRLYKDDVLIAAGAADKKGFLEASVIRNVSFLTAGEGKVTFLTAYDLMSHEMLDKYLRAQVIQWLKTSHRPDVLPDGPSLATAVEEQTDLSGVAVAPSATEEALVPSVGGF